MNELTFRPAQDNDLPSVCRFIGNRLELAHLMPRAEFPLAPERLKAAAAKAEVALLACRDGVAVGYASLFRGEARGDLYIGQVMVAPECRNQGVGLYLLNAMIGHAVIRYHAREVWLSCFAGNTPALLLYDKLGFQPVNMRSFRVPSGERVVLLNMRLALRERLPSPTPPEEIGPVGLMSW